MSPNASHRVRPGLSSAASLITTLLISFDQEVLNQHLNLVTPEYPFFESPWAPSLGLLAHPIPPRIDSVVRAQALSVLPSNSRIPARSSKNAHRSSGERSDGVGAG